MIGQPFEWLRRCGAEALTLSGLVLAVLLTPGATRPAAAQFGWFGSSEASPEDVQDTIASHGFRLIGPLYRNGRVYVADVVDRRQRRERLVIAAESGQIVQRFFVDVARPDRTVPDAPSNFRRPPSSDDSFFSHLTRGWDDSPPPRPPIGLADPDGGFGVPRAEPPPRQRPRQEPRVVTRTDVAPVTATPLPPPTVPAPTRKPEASQATLPATAPQPAPPSSTRATTVVIDPLRIPGTRKPDEAKPPAAIAAGKPADQPSTQAKPAEPPKSADVPVAPLD
ncbi:hypothetical protein [Lichenifustis flavocetrariae]|uniref:Uncharacterized protein n=1 Tax=Lichenifustis flavocetrariae TaxID=2949735 RepID=A0AA41YY03_9HYPH|nr:hypothetical protein [Lichenifustis flavocetrariae]MCW6510209.1 hypothetical protein [Lichenifustis flavocetrariae]